MERRTFLRALAPIVIAPAIVLDELSKGKSFVGWTRSLEQKTKFPIKDGHFIYALGYTIDPGLVAKPLLGLGSTDVITIGAPWSDYATVEAAFEDYPGGIEMSAAVEQGFFGHRRLIPRNTLKLPHGGREVEFTWRVGDATT